MCNYKQSCSPCAKSGKAGKTPDENAAETSQKPLESKAQPQSEQSYRYDHLMQSYFMRHGNYTKYWHLGP